MTIHTDRWPDGWHVVRVSRADMGSHSIAGPFTADDPALQAALETAEATERLAPMQEALRSLAKALAAPADHCQWCDAAATHVESGHFGDDLWCAEHAPKYGGCVAIETDVAIEAETHPVVSLDLDSPPFAPPALAELEARGFVRENRPGESITLTFDECIRDAGAALKIAETRDVICLGRDGKSMMVLSKQWESLKMCDCDLTGAEAKGYERGRSEERAQWAGKVREYIEAHRSAGMTLHETTARMMAWRELKAMVDESERAT